VPRLRFITPAAPVLVGSPPMGADWLHEIKWDGWRLQIIRDANGVRIFSRKRVDWCDRLPDIADAVAALKANDVIIDAALVGDGGFYSLHSAIKRRQVSAIAFDVMHLDGMDLRGRILEERKQKLADLLAGAADCLQIAEVFTDGVRLLQAAEDQRFEGIVSKRRGSLYRSGRCLDWLEVKTKSWSAANKNRHKLFQRRRSLR
jgi:bifunctional non-homologous end joining protein LigD